MVSLYVRASVLVALLASLVTSQILDFSKDGNVGVNFGGYRASAGLGGLLTGDASRGGLHAEAGTPFGQAAGAGLGGHIASDGTSQGGLYAGATAGGGVSAGAGLGGTAAKTGSVGVIGAGAGSKGVIKTAYASPALPLEPVLVEKAPAATYVAKHVHIGSGVVQKVPSAGPVKHVVPLEPAPVVYLQKTHVRRPHHHHRKQAYFNAGLSAGSNLGGYQDVVPVVHSAKVIEKTYVHPAPPRTVVVHKEAPAPAPVVVNKYAPPRGGLLTRIFAGINTGSAGVPAVSVPAGKGPAPTGGEVIATYMANAFANQKGNVINDIFNIPISTLTAVNRLVSNIVGDKSLTVTKQVSASAAADGHVQGAVQKH